MKAHQKRVRDSVEASGIEEGLFGQWWSDLKLSPENAIIKAVSNNTAKYIIDRYEWMGCMSAITWFSFGLYFDGNCAGVVCYGPEYSENLGIQARRQGRKCADWSAYGFEGKMILLNRGACVHWAPPFAASMLIRGSMKMLPKKFEVVTALTDPLAGEIGTVYQASGFYYIGSMRDANKNVDSKKGDRDAWLVGKKLYGSRAMRQKCGSTKAEDIAKLFPQARKVAQESKRRYFAFLGSKAAKKTHKKAIEHLIKEYPKRGKSQERDAGFQPEGSGQC